jgi:ABC-type branched-subunit amino acid transport system ATPase component/HPt (histidine-containing phosphotransfer) domain-containing protein
LLKLENIQSWYGKIQALKGISLHLEEGEIVALLGANGAGKTTTLMSISGILPIKKGNITFQGKRISGLSPDKIVELGIMQVPEGRHIFPDFTVKENLEMGAYIGFNKNKFKKDLDYVFSLFPILKERLYQTGGTLSGGEQQMLAISRALMCNPKLLVLDEPSLGLAPLIIKQIFEIIKIVNKEHGTTILDDEGLVSKVLLSVRDVTEQKKLQSEARAQKRELNIIGEILKVPEEKFHEFVIGTRKFIEENRKLIHSINKKDDEIISLLFRNMHTIKGNARTFELSYIVDAVHTAENEYDELRKNEKKAWDQSMLLGQLKMVQLSLDEYYEINNEKLHRNEMFEVATTGQYFKIGRKKVHDLINSFKNINLEDIEILLAKRDEFYKTLLLSGTEKLQNIIRGIIDSVSSLAIEMGKNKPNVVVNDNNISIRHEAFECIQNSFVQLFRNSVAHGIGTKEERIKVGKDETGLIQLDMKIESDKLVFVYKDDGEGIDLIKLKNKAVEMKLINNEQLIEPETIDKIIFKSGVSTAEQVTELSGRGVGLDAVKKFFEKENGEVKINFLNKYDKTTKRAPFEFVLKLPANLAVQASTLKTN